MGGGFAGTVISHRSAEALSFFGDGFGSVAFGRDDLPSRIAATLGSE